MNNRRVAVVGGGISGLTVAYRLLQKGFKVKLFESLDRLGGLASTIKIHGEPVEIFYHHFFSTDDYLFKISRELGLYDKIRWFSAKMGYLTAKCVYDFGTPVSLLSFKPLSLSEKIRFGLSVLQIQREKSLEELDRYTAKEWLVRRIGQKAFDIIWEPLLIQKFGDEYKDVSMAWLCRKIQVRSLSKTNILGIERLAYLDGSLQIFIDRLVDKIKELGGEIALAQKVEKIDVDNLQQCIVKTTNSAEKFDAIVSAVPAAILDKIVSFPNDYNAKLKELKQVSVICVLMVLKTRLTDYYWLNIGDNGFPFGLLVEHTNFCDTHRYKDRHIVYLSKYVDETNELYSQFSDKKIEEIFLRHLSRINRDFNQDWIEDIYVFRAAYAQPLVCKDYLKIKPGYQTTLPNFYWVSTSHIYPDDRGVNYLIKMAEEVVEAFNI